MKKIEQFNKIIYAIIFTFFTMFVFLLNLEQPSIGYYNETSALYEFIYVMLESLKEFDMIYVALSIFVFYTYYQIYFDGTKLKKSSIFNIVLAIILSIITILGKSYKIDNTLRIIFVTPAQFIKCLLVTIGYYLIFYAFIKKLSTFKILKSTKKKSPFWEKVKKIINRYQTVITIFIIVLGWLPYIICYLPGASTGDTVDSLSQFFHLETCWSKNTIFLINEDVYINKHHPPIFTVILGLIFKLGEYLGSFTLGAYIYTILQVILLIAVFCFMLHYMKQKKVPLWIRIISIIFLAITPQIARHMIRAIKDGPNAAFNVLYIIFLIQIVRNYDSIFKRKSRIVMLIIVMLLVLLFRNNGMYTILLSFPFLILLYKNKWKKIILVLLVVFSIYGVYDKLLLPSFDVTNGSIKEILTVPFMQLARVVHHHDKEFSEEEKEIINEVLDFETIRISYEPMIADSVKDTFKKEATNEEIKEFFKLWFKYLKKYPIVYLESIVNSTYGYFFPEVNYRDALAVDNRVGPGSYFKLTPIEEYQHGRTILEKTSLIFERMPLLWFISHTAFYDWLLIFSCIYVIKNKNYKYLIPLAPLVSILLICLLSPLNGSFRYILPIIFATPLIISIDYFTYKETIKNKI